MEMEGVQNGEGQKNGRQRVMDMASIIEDEMELDATHGCDRRPKQGKLKERTPAGERHGVQGEIVEHLDAAL